jgi:hypothetical protein
MQWANFWRRSILVLCAIGFVQLVMIPWGTYTHEGDVVGGYAAFDAVTIAGQFTDAFVNVRAGTAAARAGIRSGDRIDLRAMSAADRYRWRNGVLFGAPIVLPIHRGNTFITVTVLPTPQTQSMTWPSIAWLYWAFLIGSACSLIIASLLAWRRPDSPEVRTLSLALILVVIGNDLFPSNGWISTSAVLDALLNSAGQLLSSAGVALLATYSLLFGHPVSPARRALTLVAYTSAALSALAWTGAPQGSPGAAGVAGILAFWYGTFDGYFWFQSHPFALFAVTATPSILALACAVLAFRDSSGGEKQRIAWAAGSLAVLFLFGVASVQKFFVSDPFVYHVILNVGWFIAPLGLLYSLLTRRLLDLGFALNRAAVFTAVSLVVVGLFTLAEWALGGWLHGASRITNVAVSASLALVLGLFLHPIHARVDRIVDGLFFRKRHEDERALRQFSEEASYITDAATILERAAKTLEQHANATSVDFSLFDGVDHYGSISENDPAFVTLRASRNVVDLSTSDTALPGEFAFPMLARGRLVGALALGPKRDGESYAPDELGAIAQVARSVGIALDLVHAPSDKPDGVLKSLLQAHQTTIALNQAIVETLKALPEAVAEKLRK